MSKLLFRTLLFLFIQQCTVVQAAWFFDASSELHFNDNIFNGALDVDVKSDTALQAELSAGRHWQIGDASGLLIVANTGLEQYRRFTELSHAWLGISTTLHHKFGLGLHAPVLSLKGSLNYRDSRDFTRDAWQGSLGLTLSKRFSERLNMRISYRYSVDETDQALDIPIVVTLINVRGDVYDLASQQLAINFVYSLTDKLALYGGYTRRHGDVVSSTLLNATVFNVSDAIAFDQAAGPNIIAYRLNSRSDMFSLGISWALDQHMSLNASYARWHTTTRGNFVYNNNHAFLSLLYTY